jgi:hypothetical protein
MSLTSGPFLRMSLAPNGKMLAYFSPSGYVRVTKTDFSKELSQFETKSPSPPAQLSWCGSDAVLAYWELDEPILILIGPEGKFLRQESPSPVYLISEIDGIRILSAQGCDFLQRVPAVTVIIFKIGSVAPPALLVSALELFDKKDPKADAIIRDIKSQGQLAPSVEACVEAAGYEFDVQLQKHLLRAASFGKSYLNSRAFESSRFVETTKLLRVLNQVSDSEIGIPLTSIQYQKFLTPQRLIDRLILRHRHLQASKISEYLNLRSEDGKQESRGKVLVSWAKAMVHSKDIPDDILLLQIHDRIKNFPGIDFAEIAREAFMAKRTDLAALLLENEPHAHKQIPLLLTMDKPESALDKALKSGDVDLIDNVLKVLRENPEFYRLLQKYPDAYNIWTQIQSDLSISQF